MQERWEREEREAEAAAKAAEARKHSAERRKVQHDRSGDLQQWRQRARYMQAASVAAAKSVERSAARAVCTPALMTSCSRCPRQQAITCWHGFVLALRTGCMRTDAVFAQILLGTLLEIAGDLALMGTSSSRIWGSATLWPVPLELLAIPTSPSFGHCLGLHSPFISAASEKVPIDKHPS